MMRFIPVLLYFFLVANVFAATDSFTVSQNIGIDNTPPSIPSPVTATAVASTQIDVSWGASTDDQMLTGYRLYRDGVHIATTSLLSYSDTGLTPSTTYTYTVEAYDWAFNISTTSAVATATTPGITVNPVLESNSGTRFQLRLFDIRVEPQETSVRIQWQTNQYAQYSLRWGRGSAYDLGFVQNDLFKKNHQTAIPDLEPGTTYMYELIGYNQQGREFVLSRESFTTKKTPDVTPPLNVSDLHAEVEGDSVRLIWSNPLDSDFSKVRVVRSYLFYPRDTSNGYIAYEGNGESFLDRNALRSNKVQYYTLFTYDTTGNISSGAVIAVGAQVTRPQYNGEVVDSNKEDTQPDIPIEVLAQYVDIDFSDVLVLQDGVRLDSTTDMMVVDRTLPVVLQIPYDFLPEHLKTIIVTVTNKQTQGVSYMLRVNADKSAYQAVLPPLSQLGTYTFLFSIYDYRTQLLSSFKGELLSAEMSTTPQFVQKIFSTGIGIRTIIFSFLLILLLLFYIYIVFLRKVSD